jgi:hypothetical protein
MPSSPRTSFHQGRVKLLGSGKNLRGPRREAGLRKHVLRGTWVDSSGKPKRPPKKGTQVRGTCAAKMCEWTTIGPDFRTIEVEFERHRKAVRQQLAAMRRSTERRNG